MSDRKSLRVTAALAATAMVAALAACGSSGSNTSGTAPASNSGAATNGLTKSTIAIGNVGLYSGSTFAAADEQTVHSLEAWVAWTNEHGGLAGHPVKLISHDDANNPSTSLQFVKEMVEKDHIVALLAPIANSTANAWASYVKKMKVPVIGGGSLDENWLTNPYMLAVNTTIVGYLTSQLGAAKTVGTKVGEFACAELTACKTGVTTFEGIAKKLGLGWAGAQLVSGTATDYIAPCLAMKDAGADVVVPELSADSIVRVIGACAQQGYKPAVVLPASNINDQVLKAPAFEGAVGVNGSPLWFGDADFTKDWKATYTKMFPKDVLTGYSTLGWQAGVVFAKALEHAPDTVTSETVMQGLYAQPAGSTFGGWTPPLTFTPGKATDVKSCMWYVQIKNGGYVAPKGDQAVCVAS